MYTVTESMIFGKRIQRDSDGAFIPVAESNLDYQEYLLWQASAPAAEFE